VSWWPYFMHRLQAGLASSHLIRRFLWEESQGSAWDQYSRQREKRTSSTLACHAPGSNFGFESPFPPHSNHRLIIHVSSLSDQTFNDGLVALQENQIIDLRSWHSCLWTCNRRGDGVWRFWSWWQITMVIKTPDTGRCYWAPQLMLFVD
jgi:hypothetical protein